MTKLFFISDTHFYHTKIIEYEDRPFISTEEMNEHMIKKNNEIVSNDDILMNLGDFSFGGKKLVQSIFNRLNGQKYLLLGNHDRKRTLTWWKKIGFIKVFKFPIYLDNFILSHEPIDPSEIEKNEKINCHGHIHSSVHYSQFLSETIFKDHYKNFCVETLNYIPFEIKDNKLKEQLLSFLKE